MFTDINMRKKVEEAPNLERDDTTKAILNTDKNGLFAYKKQREMLTKLLVLDEEVYNIKKDVSDIKLMLVETLTALRK